MAEPVTARGFREHFTAWADGRAKRLPVWRTFGMQAVRADDDGATIRLPLEPFLLDARGRLPAGVVAVLADSAVGCSLAVAMERADFARPSVTVTLTLEPTVEELPTSGHLECTGRLIARHEPHVLMAADVRDEAGRQVAEVRAWFNLLVGRVAEPISWDDPDEGFGEDPGPLDGPDAGLGPIGNHLGLIRADGSADGARTDGARSQAPGARLRLRSRPGFCNRLRTLHGGVGALIADLAAGAALGGERYQPLTATYSYLRTTGRVGQIVNVEAEVVKPGRAVAMAESRVLTADGRVALHAVVNADVAPR
ncbi:MAG TPA: hypothetical protein VHE83_03015 [Mycobacteriales bacterium]|nr:hypothetical protein [Mycobacteriales bacterium]